ncbi:hypothetical protein ACFY1B_13385, partial [Streptomyces mirabilis]
MTEHPTSHERRQSGAGRPSTPADPRGALLRTPEPQRAPGALPAQPDRTGDAPTGSAPSTPYGRHGSPATQASASTDTPSPSGTGASTPSPASPGPEHSQPSASEPDAHRPRPAPEGIPAQPGMEGDRPSGASTGTDRRTGQGLPHAGPMPMRRDGDRLRFVGAATRRIARGIDLDEIVMGLCRATVPTFSDAIPRLSARPAAGRRRAAHRAPRAAAAAHRPDPRG